MQIEGYFIAFTGVMGYNYYKISQSRAAREKAAAEQGASGASNASSPTTKELYANGGTDEEAGLVGSASKLPKQQTLSGTG